MNLTQAIKEQAIQAGFSLVGVTTADPLPHAGVFANWLNQGRHGEMTYLDSPRSRLCRAQPEQVLPGCQSVLVLGVRYPEPPAIEEYDRDHTPLSGRVAAYARGKDYHDILPERLKTLAGFIESQVGHFVPNRWYTDTGPLLERELAQRAGLGWIGKNTCLIAPGKGSYFLLAEILLGIELEPDPPFSEDRCGKCTRCIDACPTGCILPDRTLDSRRCISYLTIELKGQIPPELRPRMGDWIFGCDICQQVCPWNRFQAVEIDPLLEHDRTKPFPDLLDELILSASEFNHKYRHSPLKRTKRRGYLRNVSVALGNTRRPEAVPMLHHVLMKEVEPLVRAHAAWALGRIGDQAAWAALKKASALESDQVVKLEIQAALDIDRTENEGYRGEFETHVAHEL